MLIHLTQARLIRRMGAPDPPNGFCVVIDVHSPCGVIEFNLILDQQ
jgi:hypothetical protein